MDQKKTGAFIAARRRALGMTQEALGEKLGVTNKTVSRWETGAYMPGIDMLEPLSASLGVSVHELLRGERLEEERFREEADRILVSALKDSGFGFQEQMTFWKKKWKKDHWQLFVWGPLLWIGAIAYALWRGTAWLPGAASLVLLGYYGFFRNRMMIYVEDKLYGKTED